MNLDGVRALITGASAGIGREFARQLAARSDTLILVARRGDRLEQLRADLLASNPQVNVLTRVIDLADRTQLNTLADWIQQNQISVDLLINNAGLGDIGPFATGEIGRDERIIDVNIAALTLLTRRLIPQMIAQKRGAVVNVSSSAAFLPIPGFAVYAATKAYVNSFSEALRVELRGTGVSVTAVCPGPVHTEFQEIAQRPGGRPDSGPEFVYVSTEQVVADALAAVTADRPLVIPGFFMRLGMFLVRLTPLAILRRISRYSTKQF